MSISLEGIGISLPIVRQCSDDVIEASFILSLCMEEKIIVNDTFANFML